MYYYCVCSEQLAKDTTINQKEDALLANNGLKDIFHSFPALPKLSAPSHSVSHGMLQYYSITIGNDSNKQAPQSNHIVLLLSVSLLGLLLLCQ